MKILEETECCGVDQTSGLSIYPHVSLRKICKDKYVKHPWEEEYKQAFIMISDIVKRNRGKRLITYIKKHKLGSVISMRQKKNPNSGNVIKVWLWSPNERLLKKWYKKYAK